MNTLLKKEFQKINSDDFPVMVVSSQERTSLTKHLKVTESSSEQLSKCWLCWVIQGNNFVTPYKKSKQQSKIHQHVHKSVILSFVSAILKLVEYST